MQLTYYNSKFSKRNFPIKVVSDGVSNALNIGSLFRVADAFGVEKLYLCGQHISLGPKMAKSARSTHKSVPFEIKENTEEVIQKLIQDNYQIIAMEISSESKPLHNFRLRKNQPIALVVGAEKFGISKEVLNLADQEIHIEMFGQNSSMNVVQATNIALYEITRQFL